MIFCLPETYKDMQMSNLRTAMLKRMVLLTKLEASSTSKPSAALSASHTEPQQQAQQLMRQVLENWATGIRMLQAGVSRTTDHGSRPRPPSTSRRSASGAAKVRTCNRGRLCW